MLHAVQGEGTEEITRKLFNHAFPHPTQDFLSY